MRYKKLTDVDRMDISYYLEMLIDVGDVNEKEEHQRLTELAEKVLKRT